MIEVDLLILELVDVNVRLNQASILRYEIIPEFRNDTLA